MLCQVRGAPIVILQECLATPPTTLRRNDAATEDGAFGCCLDAVLFNSLCASPVAKIIYLTKVDGTLLHAIPSVVVSVNLKECLETSIYR